jgi:hypothetical protein
MVIGQVITEDMADSIVVVASMDTVIGVDIMGTTGVEVVIMAEDARAAAAGTVEVTAEVMEAIDK